MERRTVTLRQAVDILAEQGIDISWTKDLTLEDFLTYYDHHYAHGPINTLFLVDDIHDIFRTA